MFDNQTWELLINAGLPTLAALAVLGCALTIVLTSRSSGRTQRDLVKVLNKQMENETKRDQREDRRQDEAERHNKRLEDLIDKLIAKEDERFIQISDGLVTIHENQEVIKKGVHAMSNNEMTESLKTIEELLKIMIANQESNNKKLLRMEQMLIAPAPAAYTDPATLADKPFSDKPYGEKTQPLATPGTTVEQEKAADTTPPVDNSKDKK